VFRHFIAVTALVLAQTVVQASPLPTMADAQHAYYVGQYRRSLALFEQLAAARNAEAAECAGFMLLSGETTYGAQVHRDLERAKHYLVQAAASGRSGAQFLLNMVERTD
jgi:TPR repeat protein